MGGAGRGATVREEGLPDPFWSPSGPPCSAPQAVHCTIPGGAVTQALILGESCNMAALRTEPLALAPLR